MSHFPSSLRRAAAAAAFALAAAPSVAAANGRYPAAGQIAFDPSDPGHILVRATYGLLVTPDGGGSWSWICEAAVGYSGIEDPMVAFTADGSLLAGLFEGLAASHDGGCQWDLAGGGLAGRYAIDLSTQRDDPSKAVLIVSNSVTTDTFSTQLWETADDGNTWTQAGVDLPNDFLGLTVDTAPTDPARVYASGRLGANGGYAGVFARSDDRGASWQELPITGADSQHLPYISGIDPANPDVIYLRLDGETDALLVTKDGGATWSSVFEGTGDLLGFALSPDGATVAIGGPVDGLWTAPASTLQFQKIASVGARCLTWTAEGLYACADEFKDGFTAGKSTDEGKTFTPIMHLNSLCGPLACGQGTSTAEQCPNLWGVLKDTIQAKGCDGSGGGASGSSGASGGGGAGGETGGSGGCSCTTASPYGTSALGGLAVAGAIALLGRRRGRRCDNVTHLRARRGTPGSRRT